MQWGNKKVVGNFEEKVQLESGVDYEVWGWVWGERELGSVPRRFSE